jgi:hypothetical protein
MSLSGAMAAAAAVDAGNTGASPRTPAGRPPAGHSSSFRQGAQHTAPQLALPFGGDVDGERTSLPGTPAEPASPFAGASQQQLPAVHEGEGSQGQQPPPRSPSALGGLSPAASLSRKRSPALPLHSLMQEEERATGGLRASPSARELSRLHRAVSMRDVGNAQLPQGAAPTPAQGKAAARREEGGAAARKGFWGSTSAKLRGSIVRFQRKMKKRKGTDTSEVDAHVPLTQQLVVAALITTFVQYPHWATAGLGVFACRVLDSAAGAGGAYGLAHYSTATAASGYWTSDMSQACYEGVHGALAVPLAVAVLVCLSLGPPAASFLLLRFKVGPARLRQRTVRRVYGFLYDEFRPTMYWWQSVAQLQTLALVATQVFSTVMAPLYQVTLMLITLLATGALEILASPSKHAIISALRFCSSTVLVLTLGLSFLCVDGALMVDPTGAVSGASQGLVRPVRPPPACSALR